MSMGVGDTLTCSRIHERRLVREATTAVTTIMPIKPPSFGQVPAASGGFLLGQEFGIAYGSLSGMLGSDESHMVETKSTAPVTSTASVDMKLPAWGTP